MAIFRNLQKILKNTIRKTTFKNPSSPLNPISLLTHRNRFLHSLFSLADVTLLSFPFIKGGGPLFPSSPSWQFCQTERLFERSGVGFPVVLRFRSAKDEEVKKCGGGVGGSGVRRESGDGEDGGGGGGVVESFVNWPNFVSVSRMVSGPVLGWMIVNEWYLPAFVGLAISGASDWLDGYLARRLGIHSVVGSYLDPLADKVLVGCVVLAMVENNLLHSGLVGLVVVRDVMLVGGAVYKRASSLNWQWKSWYDFFNLDGTRPEKVEPLFISKVNTVFQLILVAAALLQPEFGTSETQAYITYLSWLVASTTVASTAAYGVQHMRNRTLAITRSR